MVGDGKYGMWVFRFGVLLHSDGRRRYRLPGYESMIRPAPKRGMAYRGTIRGWSRESARRLAFVAANAEGHFGSHLTLTYRARTEEWEDDAARNQRVIRRSKADLHRFLACLRQEIGRYLWVQEFQRRGVVHYHVLTEAEIGQERAALAWSRASGQLDDPDVMRHGVKAESVRHQQAAKGYLGSYVGKARQKCLPPGVDGAGRWWGRSRSLQLMLLEEVVSHDKADGLRRPGELQTVRALRRYIGKVFGGSFRGGMFLDWGGKLAEKLRAMTVELRTFYGVTPSLEEMRAGSWMPVKGVEDA